MRSFSSPFAKGGPRGIGLGGEVEVGTAHPTTLASEFTVDIMVKGLQSFDGCGAAELAAIERGNAARMFAKCGW